MLFGACLAAQANFRPYVSEVMPLVIDAIQDITSTSKRLVAVKTLGQVRGEGRLRRWPYAVLQCFPLMLRDCS